MVIIHVASIKNVLTAGVDVAVPQHIRAQSVNNQVALVNVNNISIDAVELQFEYRSDFRLNQFPEPFCEPDLVVFHNTYYIDFVKIAKKLQKLDIPYVIIPHGTLARAAQRKKWLKKTLANWLIFNNFFNNAKAIQFLSPYEMEASKYQGKGFISTNGIVRPRRQSFLKNRDGINIVYIGRIDVRIKGLDMMLNAVSQNYELFKKNNIHLNLYGPDIQGGYSQTRSIISKYKIEEYVTLHDSVVGEAKERVLLDADVFIQTSRSEGMPMGLLEALSYGIPCIVTEGTGLGNIISKYNAGWVAKTNSEGIAKAIRDAVNERCAWNFKSEQANKLITENYDWEKVVETALSEYKKIVGKCNT